MRYATAEIKVVRLRECAPVRRMDAPKHVDAFWRKHVTQSSWYDADKECVVVFLLSTQRRLKGFNLVSLGTVNSVLMEPSEVLRPAIVNAAPGIILAHNHPSGYTHPSDDDIQTTRHIQKAAKLMRIELVDHLIIGRGYYSFKEKGHIQ